MLAVEAISVSAQKPFHAGHEVGLGRFDDQMKVIGHQTRVLNKELKPYVLAVLILAEPALFAKYCCGGPSETLETVRIYSGSWQQCTTALTNAFSAYKYHHMGFLPSLYHYDVDAKRWSRIPTTNEWSLYAVDKAIPATLGNKTVSYYPEFNLIANQIASNKCKITVRTISAWIPDGKEIGIHGGLAGHAKHVRPIMAEETNVLNQIEIQLGALLSASLCENSRRWIDG